MDPYIRERVTVDDNGCWLWQQCRNHGGYAKATIDQKAWLVHRFTYINTVGPVPDGLVLDHLCRVRHCVNPDHLEPVTRGENVMRGKTRPAANAAKSHCINGHPFDSRNTYVSPQGTRGCRTCVRERSRRPGAKPYLPDADVIAATRRALAGERPEDLAEEYGVSAEIIYLWRRGKYRGRLALAGGE